jgi:ATP-dependent DNA helicase RecG
MLILSEVDLRAAMAFDSETEHLEFKEARQKFDFDKLVEYCCALANEGGGSIILGVTNQLPRQIVGTEAYRDIESRKIELLQRLRWRIEILELHTQEGRVLVFNVPGRPSGRPLEVKGTFWMRVGESLTPMTLDQIMNILAESTKDFSAEIAEGVDITALDEGAIAEFRKRWARKSSNVEISSWSNEILLENAELTVDGQMTNAALILLGTRVALGRHLAQAELVFEYRSKPGSVEYQQREEYRRGFLSWFEDLWTKINLRNEMQQYQEGLFRYDIPTFGEETVREAILNAVCHRDYQDGGSIWVRQFPRLLEIESPGGFPQGVNAENILKRQHPRNRRIAEVLAKCGFVERSGQGADRMFRQSIRNAKPLPDYSGSDGHHVVLRLNGEVGDPRFIKFLEKVGEETLARFNTEDFLVLNLIRREERVPEALKARLALLREIGVVEPLTRQKVILSRRFYEHLGEAGVYTRKRGLDQDYEKGLLHTHIVSSKQKGAPMKELMEVLPGRSRAYVGRLLQNLRAEGKVHPIGIKRGARWHSGPEQGPEAKPG